MKRNTFNKLISKINIYSVVEDIFLIIMGIYLSFLVYNTSPMSLDIAETAEQNLFIWIFIAVGVKLIFVLIRNVDNRKYALLVSLALISALFYFFSFESTEYTFLSFLPLLTLGMIGSDYRKVAKFYSFFLVLSLGIIIVLGISGLVVDYVYLKEGIIRSSWGIGYPTDFASYCLFLCITAWIGWDKISDWFFVLFGFTASDT